LHLAPLVLALFSFLKHQYVFSFSYSLFTFSPLFLQMSSLPGKDPGSPSSVSSRSSRRSSASSILSINSTASTQAQLLALVIRKTPSISSVSSAGSLKAPPYSPYEKGIPRSGASSRSSARSTPRVPTPGGKHVYSKYEPSAPTFKPIKTPARPASDGQLVFQSVGDGAGDASDVSTPTCHDLDSVPSHCTLDDSVISRSTLESKDPELLGVVSWETPPISRNASISSVDMPRRTPSVPSSRILSRRGSGDSLAGVKGDSSQDSLPGLDEELRLLSENLHSSKKKR
jgi:hypothetical protein